MFYEHKIQIYIILTLFSKIANFGVLHIYIRRNTILLANRSPNCSTHRQDYSRLVVLVSLCAGFGVILV